jgi:hypothetical protein
VRTFLSWLKWIAVAAFAAAAVFVATFCDVKLAGWGGCPADKVTHGRYGAIATLDWRGFVRPFGRLNFDEPGEWKAVFSNAMDRESKVIVKDKSALNALKAVRFECGIGDIGTATFFVEVMKGDEVVYHSAYVLDEWPGLQNQDLGFSPVAIADKKAFKLLFGSVPEALRSK